MKKNTKTIDELVIIVEGLLFSANDPLSPEALAKLFIDEIKPKAQDIKKALVILKKHFHNRGIELVEVASGFRFQVAQDIVPYIAKTIEEKPARYSRALLETMALIAYRQPITRGEIEDIRGVVVSTNIIKTLDEQGWIRVVGYKEVPGKPALYATTKGFLDHFGLKNLEDLPPLAALKDFDSIEPNFSDEENISPEENQLELDIAQDVEASSDDQEEEEVFEDDVDEIKDAEDSEESEHPSTLNDILNELLEEKDETDDALA